jgi:hypothetical protein
MNLMRAYLCLLIAISSLVFMLGCEEEEKEDLEPPKVVNTLPMAGDQIPPNAIISVIFSKQMKSVEISVSDAEGITKLQGKTATWTSVSDMLPGAHTLTVIGTDIHGQELVGFTPVEFGVSDECSLPPEFDNDMCDPKNGAIDVEPESYQEKLVVAFNEPLSKAKVVATDPKFPFTAELMDDGRTLEIKFRKYIMPNNTKFTITLDVADLASNGATLEYSFTTL